MFGITRKTAIKATLVSLASMIASVIIVLVLVPLLGGHPDGPGFWMSALCPLLIAWPTSAWQFAQAEKLQRARDELAGMNLLLDRMHSELTRAHVALKEKARVDAMTGALNRDSFFAMLDLAARTNKRGTLLLADADHFKRINDSYGHHTGDEALRGISASIVSALGQQDFWGRIGGEEFAIFIDGADRFEAEYVAESIRLGVSALDIRCEDSPVAVTVSIGGLSLSGPFDPATAVREADRRLYLAKRGGRNRSVLEAGGEESTEAA